MYSGGRKSSPPPPLPSSKQYKSNMPTDSQKLPRGSIYRDSDQFPLRAPHTPPLPPEDDTQNNHTQNYRTSKNPQHQQAAYYQQNDQGQSMNLQQALQQQQQLTQQQGASQYQGSNPQLEHQQILQGQQTPQEVMKQLNMYMDPGQFPRNEDTAVQQNHAYTQSRGQPVKYDQEITTPQEINQQSLQGTSSIPQSHQMVQGEYEQGGQYQAQNPTINDSGHAYQNEWNNSNGQSYYSQASLPQKRQQQLVSYSRAQSSAMAQQLQESEQEQPNHPRQNSVYGHSQPPEMNSNQETYNSQISNIPRSQYLDQNGQVTDSHVQRDRRRQLSDLPPHLQRKQKELFYKQQYHKQVETELTQELEAIEIKQQRYNDLENLVNENKGNLEEKERAMRAKGYMHDFSREAVIKQIQENESNLQQLEDQIERKLKNFENQIVDIEKKRVGLHESNQQLNQQEVEYQLENQEMQSKMRTLEEQESQYKERLKQAEKLQLDANEKRKHADESLKLVEVKQNRVKRWELDLKKQQEELKTQEKELQNRQAITHEEHEKQKKRLNILKASQREVSRQEEEMSNKQLEMQQQAPKEAGPARLKLKTQNNSENLAITNALGPDKKDRGTQADIIKNDSKQQQPSSISNTIQAELQRQLADLQSKHVEAQKQNVTLREELRYSQLNSKTDIKTPKSDAEQQGLRKEMKGKKLDNEFVIQQLQQEQEAIAKQEHKIEGLMNEIVRRQELIKQDERAQEASNKKMEAQIKDIQSQKKQISEQLSKQVQEIQAFEQDQENIKKRIYNKKRYLAAQEQEIDIEIFKVNNLEKQLVKRQKDINSQRDNIVAGAEEFQRDVISNGDIPAIQNHQNLPDINQQDENNNNQIDSEQQPKKIENQQHPDSTRLDNENNQHCNIEQQQMQQQKQQIQFRVQENGANGVAHQVQDGGQKSQHIMSCGDITLHLSNIFNSQIEFSILQEKKQQ